MPKSATRVEPSAVRSRFSGLMSRCTTPCRWAYSSARAASAAIRSAASTGSCLSRLQTVAERLSLHVGHGEPELPRRLARVVDGEDVGMLEPRGEPDLPLEALGAEAWRRDRGGGP